MASQHLAKLNKDKTLQTADLTLTITVLEKAKKKLYEDALRL